MRSSRRLWPRFLVFGVCWILATGLTSHGQERPPAFEQIVGRPRGVPQLAPEGEWVEIINATARWVVIQTQSGQQFPIEVKDLGDFLVRWPSSLDALGPQSVVEAMAHGPSRRFQPKSPPGRASSTSSQVSSPSSLTRILLVPGFTAMRKGLRKPHDQVSLHGPLPAGTPVAAVQWRAPVAPA